jgi:hypothetical protein
VYLHFELVGTPVSINFLGQNIAKVNKFFFSVEICRGSKSFPVRGGEFPEDFV